MRRCENGDRRNGLLLQERDRHLLRELAVMRVVDREQAKLVAGFGSITRVNVRLAALTRAGLLTRFFLATQAGGAKAIYALSSKGARAVGASLGWPLRRQNKTLSANYFVEHQLTINEVYCALRYQPVPIANTRFVGWMSFRQPVDAGTSLVPDGYAELLSSTTMITAFLEVDLGSEALSIWEAKTRKYLQYALSGNFEKQFHRPQFRVLVIANSERRLQSIRTTVAAATNKIFWFSSLDLIRREGLWSPVWLRPKDDRPQPLF